MILLSIVRQSLSLAKVQRQLCWQWWAQVESNHRPHAYQACALTFWAMSPCYLHNHRNRLTRRSVPWTYGFGFFNRWWRWRDSNPWPPACRAGALPAELHPHKGFAFTVSMICRFLCGRSLTIEQQDLSALALPVMPLVIPPLAFNPTSGSFCRYYIRIRSHP